jgi:hypothetical protein
VFLLAEFQFCPVRPYKHPHVPNGMLSVFGVDRVLAAAIEASADTLATKERIILHGFIVSGLTLLNGGSWRMDLWAKSGIQS